MEDAKYNLEVKLNIDRMDAPIDQATMEDMHKNILGIAQRLLEGKNYVTGDGCLRRGSIAGLPTYQGTLDVFHNLDSLLGLHHRMEGRPSIVSRPHVHIPELGVQYIFYSKQRKELMIEEMVEHHIAER